MKLNQWMWCCFYAVVYSLFILFINVEPVDSVDDDSATATQEASKKRIQTEWLVEQMFGTSDFTSIMSTAVDITAYSAREEECDSTPEVTADMTPSRIGVLAISRDIRTDLHIQMGQVVVLEGLGVFKVHDVMNSRFKRRVDILHANPKAAKLFGKRRGSLIWLI